MKEYSMTPTNKIKINLDSLKSRREWKRHKVKEGHNVFRILPPFGENSNGYAYKKWQIIWGLTDPESGRARPFASSMTSEKRCPVTEYVQTLKSKSEQLRSQLQASGESEEVVQDRLKPLNKLITDLSPKTVYIYNAADKSGEVGLLELKSTAHKKMKAEMVQYIQDYNQDPTSLNSEDSDSGVWFDVIRTGEGRNTEYDVKKHQNKVKKATGGISFDDDRSPLPDSIVENYDNLAYDLSSVYQIKSYDELKEILEANMPLLVDLCQDASIGESQPVQTKAQPSKTTATTKGSKPVSLKLSDLDDEEDDVDVIMSSRKALSKSSSLDDDFLAEADAILNA
jgi:hypothetical protein